MRILIVDDDEMGSKMVQFLLTEQGYQVDIVDNARGALALVERQPPDLMLLDVMMPQFNGFQIYQRLRERDFDIPVIFVTGKDELEDKLQGLRMGADDYICKPFQPAELTARVEAVLRRYKKSLSGERRTLLTGSLQLDIPTHMVTLPDGRNRQLTQREMQLLLELVHHAGHAVSREDLLDAVWGENYPGGSNIVDVFVRRLRQKLERDPAAPALIQAVRGIGYKFAGDA
ncbi:MAG TPA: response regulator transcription factor [Ktedonobacterales bacterium]|nr:response regulator transcription factor [Ktedonobacterales bacterium]